MNIVQNIKYLLVFAFVIPNIANATNYPLSSESKQFIVNSAIVGGVIGGGLGLIAAFEKQSEQKHSKDATAWEKIKSFPWHYVILPALAGAAGAGFIASFHTSEEYLKSAEQELVTLENDSFLNFAMQTDDASELRRVNSKMMFPSLSAYDRLESFLAKIKNIKEYLFTVIKSGTTGLSSIAQGALNRLNAIEDRINNAMINIKDSSDYLKELALRAEFNFKNQMLEAARRTAAAAERQASAAQSAAHAAWHSAYHHPHPVYVAPPPVNVYVRK